MRKLLYSFRMMGMIIRWVFRFVTGRPMSGVRKTDATFWRPARHSLDPSGTALRWEMMRGASRAAWRLGGAYLLLLLPLLLLSSWLLEEVSGELILPSVSLLLWLHFSLLGGGGVSYLLRRYAREYGFSYPLPVRNGEEKLRLHWERVDGVRDWRREKVLPVARAASVILGQHIPDRTAHEWVTIPKTYRESSGSAVEIRLPPHFTGADEKVNRRLVSSVGSKLGVSNMVASWQVGGSAPRVLLSAPPTPPSFVSFSDVEKHLLSSEECRPLLGLTGDSSPLVAEMIDDSPHIALSAGPGAGKSTMAKLIAMQALRWGWGVVVLDWKQTEAYSWMGGLQGVTYLSGIEAIHDMGVRLAQEVDIRKAEGMSNRARVLVIRDEWNVTADLLMAYWQDLRSTAEPEEKKLMPVKSPALRGFAILDYAGREYGLFDLCIAQRFTARVFNGNADIRECFNIKCLARYSTQTQKMLAPDVKPFPKKSNHPGRWTIVVSDEATVIQVPLITNEEARAYAISGVENPLTPFTGSYADRPGATSPVADDTLGDQLPLGQPGATRDSVLPNLFTVTLKLSEMTDRLAPLGITLSILQKAAGDKESGFPSPAGGSPNRGYTYDFQAVREWSRTRHSRLMLEKMKK